MKYCRKLLFDEKPDYGSLQMSFKNYLISKELIDDFQFDWVNPINKDINIKNSEYNFTVCNESKESENCQESQISSLDEIKKIVKTEDDIPPKKSKLKSYFGLCRKYITNQDQIECCDKNANISSMMDSEEISNIDECIPSERLNFKCLNIPEFKCNNNYKCWTVTQFNQVNNLALVSEKDIN